ncbi:hypothetical protein E2C01_058427 [Portunus trituberculatus]|uniref:Uncharacterized protein n=1 Tax=Portunus trituberculatus TaxID=210409 RepID=A0A5B7H3Q0_PORTR|nr:hypothetical protein [Portunus trituberculatus]
MSEASNSHYSARKITSLSITLPHLTSPQHANLPLSPPPTATDTLPRRISRRGQSRRGGRH